VNENHPYLRNAKTYELQAWYTDGVWWPASPSCAATSNLKALGLGSCSSKHLKGGGTYCAVPLRAAQLVIDETRISCDAREMFQNYRQGSHISRFPWLKRLRLYDVTHRATLLPQLLHVPRTQWADKEGQLSQSVLNRTVRYGFKTHDGLFESSDFSCLRV